MRYRVGLEDIEPNHWVAWVLAPPGCFASAPTQEEAVAQVPVCISAYSDWLSIHGRPASLAGEAIDVQVVQVFHSFVSVRDPIQGDYVVNAFFEDDRWPLTGDEVEEGLWVLESSRGDLRAVLQQTSPETLRQAIAGEVHGSIAGILDHLAWAEWWYFDRLALAFAREEMPDDPFAKLEMVRAQTRAQLPRLVGDHRVVERMGEQ